VQWKPRLTKTAGKFRYFKGKISHSMLKKLSLTSDDSQNIENSEIQYSPGCIELSTKLLDTPIRTAGTLLHEMCHAAQV